MQLKQRSHMRNNNLFQQNKTALFDAVNLTGLRQFQKAGENRRNLYNCECFLGFFLLFLFLFAGVLFIFLFLQPDNDIQALIRQHREGAAAVDRHRGQYRNSTLLK